MVRPASWIRGTFCIECLNILLALFAASPRPGHEAAWGKGKLPVFPAASACLFLWRCLCWSMGWSSAFPGMAWEPRFLRWQAAWRHRPCMRYLPGSQRNWGGRAIRPDRTPQSRQVSCRKNRKLVLRKMPARRTGRLSRFPRPRVRERPPGTLVRSAYCLLISNSRLSRDTLSRPPSPMWEARSQRASGSAGTGNLRTLRSSTVHRVGLVLPLSKRWRGRGSGASPSVPITGSSFPLFSISRALASKAISSRGSSPSRACFHAEARIGLSFLQLFRQCESDVFLGALHVDDGLRA